MPGLKISSKEWVSFFLTLVATLIGVLIAIWLTNSGIRKKEKEDTIKLLNTAKLILRNTKEYSKSLENTILAFDKDTIRYSEEAIKSVKSNNPIPYPDLLETIISNELVSKKMSEYSHNSIYNGLINLRKLAKYETVGYYLKSLEEMILHLDLEVELLKGTIDPEDLNAMFNEKQKTIEKKYSSDNIVEIKAH